MKKKLLFMMVGVLLVGCGMNTVATEDSDTIKNTKDEYVTEYETESEEDIPGMEFFSQLPDEFYFSSGAGAWGTTLYLEDDGSFYVEFHDSDAGSIGDEYPNGTVYVGAGSGKFAPPTQLTQYTYSTTVESWNPELEEGEYIEDGIRYIVTDPYGLDNEGEVIFYMYGTPQNEMTEMFLSWLSGYDRHPEGELLCFGIYDASQESGFTGSIMMDDEDVSKLGGTYVGENGDKLIINLELDQYSYDIGSVEWIPIDYEAENGNIQLNRKGGFTIYLGESISYDFVLVNNTEGSIELECTNRASENVAFVMQ